MGELILKINGFDMLPYLPENGISIESYDIESDGAGEMMDGTVRRDRIATRYTILVNAINIPSYKTAQISAICKAFRPQWVDVEFNDPFEGDIVTRTFYNARRKATIFREYNGELMWRLEPFTLIDEGVPET